MPTRIVITPPASQAEISRFLREIAEHPEYCEVVHRLNGLEAEVKSRGGLRLVQWSQMRYGWHHKIADARRKLHTKICAKLVKEKSRARKDATPIAAIIIGVPGAGKSSTGVPFIEERLHAEFMSVNPDDVKVLLPEYEGWNAAALHEESAYVAEKMVQNAAVCGRHNIIYDIVGKDSAKVGSAISNFTDDGYKVYLLLTDLPAWKATARAWDRFQMNPFRLDQKKDPGRFVSPEYVYGVGDAPRKTFQSLKAHPRLMGYCHLNVDVRLGTKPVIIEEKDFADV